MNSDFLIFINDIYVQIQVELLIILKAYNIGCIFNTFDLKLNLLMFCLLHTSVLKYLMFMNMKYYLSTLLIKTNSK